MSKLSLIIRKIKTFFKIENETKLGFIKAYLYTGIARAFILFIPFNKLRKRMGKNGIETPKEATIEEYRLAKKIGWVVIQASKYTPWESKCLVQAVTVQRMLKEKGISTTIYLGVKKNEDNEMLAHAWVRCGAYVITGGMNKHEYKVVSSFAN